MYCMASVAFTMQINIWHNGNGLLIDVCLHTYLCLLKVIGKGWQLLLTCLAGLTAQALQKAIIWNTFFLEWHKSDRVNYLKYGWNWLFLNVMAGRLVVCMLNCYSRWNSLICNNTKLTLTSSKPHSPMPSVYVFKDRGKTANMLNTQWTLVGFICKTQRV